MKTSALILVVLFNSLLGGYLSPNWGITLFFLSIVFLLFAVGPDFQLTKDEVLSLLFGFCGVASALYAGDKWGAILFSGSFMAGSFFYIILRNSSDWESPLLKAIVIGGCIVGFCEALRQAGILPTGLFYNSNPFSGFLTPLVPVSFYLYSKYRRNVYVVAAALLVFANFISASRTGVATMILAFVVMALFFRRERDGSAVKALVLVFFVGFCSFLLFSQAKDALVLKGVVGMLEKQPTAIAQRADLLKVTLQVIRQAPLFGNGLNSFQAVMGMTSNPYVVPPAVHAHSLYLNILAELGIVGLALFLSFVILVIKGPFYSSFLLKVALLAFFFHNIVEYNFPPPPFQVLFYLLCAAIMRGKAPEPSLLRIRGGAARIVPVFLALYFIVVHLFPAIGLILLGRASAAAQERDVAKTLKYLFASTYFGYSVSLTHADTAHLLADVYFSSGAKDNNLIAIAEKNYLNALALNSLDGSLYLDVANFYAATGRPDRAQAYLFEVIEKYPYRQDYRLALARFYARQRRDKEAIEVLEASNAFLEKYAPLQPLRVEILLGLASLYRKQEDMERSEDLMAKAYRLKGLLERPGLLKEQTKDPDASSPR